MFSNNSHKNLRIFNALNLQYRAQTCKFEVFELEKAEKLGN